MMMMIFFLEKKHRLETYAAITIFIISSWILSINKTMIIITTSIIIMRICLKTKVTVSICCFHHLFETEAWRLPIYMQHHNYHHDDKGVGFPRQHCRLNICSYFGWFWQILRIWDEQACLGFPYCIVGQQIILTNWLCWGGALGPKRNRIAGRGEGAGRNLSFYRPRHRGY